MPEYEEVGMWANLGARTVRLRPGEAVVEATLTPDAHGLPTSKGTILHGGALAALADMALASAAASVTEQGLSVTTVDLKVDFLRPGQPGRLRAVSSIRRRTRRFCFAEASVEQEDGSIVVEARAVLAFVDW
jgi:uncharacterized protein (TIGR00369 family)